MVRRLMLLLPALVLVLTASFPAWGYVAWETRLMFMEHVTKDFIRLIPRSMGKYIYQNRYDFFRGMTFMNRNIMSSTRKIRDMEEIRRGAYARLMRDIPYCVQAFKGGDIKLDTHTNNLSGRLGMIAYSIMLQKTPEFPDLYYLEKFTRTIEDLVADNVIDVWVFYDGYADFNSLGELMETLKMDGTPTLRYVRDRDFNAKMKEDKYAIFRAPEQYTAHLVYTDRQMNNIYSNMINGIADAFVYIWKKSGMDLAHPSYSAPPGTIIDRPSRRSILAGGSVQTPGLSQEDEQETAISEGQEEDSQMVRDAAAAEENN
jgi:hypothetical protein